MGWLWAKTLLLRPRFCTCKWKEMARIRNLKTLRIKTSKGLASFPCLNWILPETDILVEAGAVPRDPPNLMSLAFFEGLTLGSTSSGSQSRAGKHKFLHCREPLSNLTVYNSTDFYSTLSGPGHTTWLFFKYFQFRSKHIITLLCPCPFLEILKNSQHKILLPKCQLFLPPVFPSLPSPHPSAIVWFSFFLALFQKKKKQLSCQYSPLVQFLSWFLTWLPCVFESEEGARRG